MTFWELREITTNAREQLMHETGKDWMTKRVEIHYEDNEDNLRRFTVNWAAIGDVSTEEAEDFMKELKVAIRIVKELNEKYAGSELTWND